MKWTHAFALWFTFCVAGALGLAQDTGPAGEIGVNYSYNQIDTSDYAVSHQNGGMVYGEYFFHPNPSRLLRGMSSLGITAEVSGSGAGSGRFYTYLFGPRFNNEWHKTHLNAWGSFEIGGARATVNGTAVYTKNSFSFAAADGLDFIATKHYVVHLFQIEFAPALVPDLVSGIARHQEDLRVSAGLGFRFGDR